jgi:hypothetical protein
VNSNDRPASRTSPNRDPVFLVLVAVAVIILAVTGWMAGRPFVAVAFHHCPAGSHAVWISSMQVASCGDSAGFGWKTVKSR